MAKTTWAPSRPDTILTSGTTIGIRVPPVDPAVANYDWSNVAEEDREQVRQDANIIVGKTQNMRDDMLDIGQRLTAIKERTPEGEFLNICNQVLKIAPRLAQKFMSVWVTWRDRPEYLELFTDQTTIFELSGPTVPQELRDQVIDEAQAARDAGGSLPRARVRTIIRPGRTDTGSTGAVNTVSAGYSGSAGLGGTTLGDGTGTVGLDPTLRTFVPANPPTPASEVIVDFTPVAGSGNSAALTEAVNQLRAAIIAIEFIEESTGRLYPVAKGNLRTIIDHTPVNEEDR